MTTSRWQRLKSDWKLTLRRAGLLITLWLIGSEFLNQVILMATQKSLASTDGGAYLIWLWAFAAVILSLLTPLVATLLVLATWKDRRSLVPAQIENPVPDFLWRHTGDLIREEMRAFGSVMMWSFLLILPGIWRFLELTFLPWVVCYSPAYQSGQQDALQEARRRFYLVWPQLLFLFFLFWLILPLPKMFFDEQLSYFDSPFTAFAFNLVDVALFVLLQWFVSNLWERTNGTDVQMARH